MTDGKKCSVCGETLAAQEAIKATGHTYGDWETVTAATCTAKGTDKRTCANDASHVETRETEMLEHTSSAWITDKDSSCEVGGTKHTECTACHTKLETAEIPVKEHTYVAVVTAPTCTADGYTTYTCSVCGESYTDSKVETAGHSFGKWVTTTAATCAEAGTQTRTCSACDATETQTIKATGKHSYGEWIVTKKATYTATGTQTQTCSVCGKTATKTIAKLATTAISKCTSSLSKTSVVYTGKALKPSVTVKNGKTTLKANTHYTVTYSNNTKIGKATVTIKGIEKNGYSGTKTLTFNIIPANVKNLKATTTTSSVKLAWSKVAGATGYRVYKLDGKKWVKVADTKNTNYTISKLKAGTNYKFAVKAYAKGGNTTYWSAASTQLATATKLATPTLKATAGTKQATLSWNKISGATGYEIWMSTKSGSGYNKVATIKNNSTVKYTKKSLKSGSTYYFKVRAYKTVDGTNVYGAYSDAMPVKAK